jgi:hypothetical protein
MYRPYRDVRRTPVKTLTARANQRPHTVASREVECKGSMGTDAPAMPDWRVAGARRKITLLDSHRTPLPENPDDVPPPVPAYS